MALLKINPWYERRWFFFDRNPQSISFIDFEALFAIESLRSCYLKKRAVNRLYLFVDNYTLFSEIYVFGIICLNSVNGNFVMRSFRVWSFYFQTNYSLKIRDVSVAKSNFQCLYNIAWVSLLKSWSCLLKLKKSLMDKYYEFQVQWGI